ncbi:hypothetical protein ATY78_03805 [Rhizobium sp. R635]|uniref:glycolate oxidase subunit GlcE n=1 Tax=Rhizobium sp. R635 TaxID=1764275 RepID=UPI000B535B01|nr:glycolate oxidase subunit GlcE [Rhizobium sp. R635]OWV87634.1 hypothetical protein ATY78_03805 [Rhizobium sp. R635]
MILSPASEDEACELVRARSASRSPVRIIGANTRSAIDPTDGDLLATTELTGIVDYDPSEMVMTARAGTALADIEAAVSEKGQFLAFEPIDLGPVLGTAGRSTIGGVMATNSSGPARFVNGAARDHLLGLRFINGAGEIIRAGGRVMKNVTGLDLPKLLAGSRGELGLITEVTFKVLPRPQTSSTLVLSCDDDAHAAKAMAAALRLPLSVSGAAFVPDDLAGRVMIGNLPEEGAVLLRMEGLTASVKERAEKMRIAMAPFGPVAIADHEASITMWNTIRHAIPFSVDRKSFVWRISLPAMSAHRFVAAIRREVKANVFYDWQGSLVWMETSEGLDAQLVRTEIAKAGGGHAVLVRARSRLDSRSFDPPSLPLLALSQRIKAALDPQTIFNPTF